MAQANKWYGTGRRKEATARVWIKPGAGEIIINRRQVDDYFGRETLKMILMQPLDIVEQRGKLDIQYIRNWLTQFAEALEKPELVTRFNDLYKEYQDD